MVMTMTTKREHADHIMSARPGACLMACDIVAAENVTDGGMRVYSIGARFRCRSVGDEVLFCLDEDGKSVTFSRVEANALERAPR